MVIRVVLRDRVVRALAAGDNQNLEPPGHLGGLALVLLPSRSCCSPSPTPLSAYALYSVLCSVAMAVAKQLQQQCLPVLKHPGQFGFDSLATGPISIQNG